MTDAFLECADITKSFGGVPVLRTSRWTCNPDP